MNPARDEQNFPWQLFYPRKTLETPPASTRGFIHIKLSHKIDAHHTIQEDSKEVIVYISPSLHVVYTSIRVQQNERTMYGSGEKLKYTKIQYFSKHIHLENELYIINNIRE